MTTEENEKARVIRALKEMIKNSESDPDVLDWVAVPREKYWELVNAVNALMNIPEIPV